MTRGRRWAVAGVVAATAATFLVAVLLGGVDSFEQISWVTGILGFATSLSVAVISHGGRRTGPSQAVHRRQWDRPPIRSGAGAVLGLGALGVVLIAVMVLGALAVLAAVLAR